VCGVLSTVNVTTPVGVPLLLVTVLVKVTLCPNTEGLGDEFNDVVVAALLTTWLCVVDVLAAKVESPL